MRIQHNMASMNANRQLGITNKSVQKSTEKLSSGYRINRSADDAAGLAISEKMRTQIRGLRQASSNCQDAISMLQTAEGALGERHSILQRARELVVQASNSSVLDDDSADFEKIQDELTQLEEVYTKIGDETQFNKKILLDGTYEGYVQTGANAEEGMEITIDATDWSGVEIDADGEANSQLLADLDDQILLVTTVRSKLGAYQNELEYQVSVDNITQENLQAAESRVRDVDMAAEMAEFSKNNILTQAGTSMLAQANQQNQSVLSLLS